MLGYEKALRKRELFFCISGAGISDEKKNNGHLQKIRILRLFALSRERFLCLIPVKFAGTPIPAVSLISPNDFQNA